MTLLEAIIFSIIAFGVVLIQSFFLFVALVSKMKTEEWILFSCGVLASFVGLSAIGLALAS